LGPIEGHGKHGQANEADEPQKAKLSTAALPNVRLWKASLGISALLALFGFIVKIAQEQFLGISLTQWGPSELSTTAGRWLIDTVLLVCQVCIKHVSWTVVWLVVVLVSVTISLEFPQNSRVFRTSRAIVVVLAFLWLTFILMNVQLPLTTIEGWLTTSLDDRFPAVQGSNSPDSAVNGCITSDAIASNNSTSGCKSFGRIHLSSKYFQGRQLYFNQQIFLSKAADIGPCVEAHPDGLPEQLRGLASKPEEWFGAAEGAEQRLQDYYVLEVACCLGAWIVLYLQRPSSAYRFLDKAVDLAMLVVSFALLPLCTLLTPYSYGKLIGATQFTKATVQQQLGAADNGGTHFLIERSDNSISVLSLIGNVPKITVIRNDQVASMELFGKMDVLRSWNSKCWFNPIAQPPPKGPEANRAPTHGAL
jgi:hypothetical protein